MHAGTQDVASFAIRAGINKRKQRGCNSGWPGTEMPKVSVAGATHGSWCGSKNRTGSRAQIRFAAPVGETAGRQRRGCFWHSRIIFDC